jgi:hypothetical protein
LKRLLALPIRLTFLFELVVERSEGIGNARVVFVLGAKIQVIAQPLKIVGPLLTWDASAV